MASFNLLYRERFEKLSTTNIADAEDAFGLKGATYGIVPVWHTMGKVLGPAVTVKMTAAGLTKGQHHLGIRAIECAQEGDVMRCSSVPISTCWHVQDGLSKNLRSPDKGVLCPFGPLGADYRESESRKGSGKATFAYRFVNCNEISVINQRFPNSRFFIRRLKSGRLLMVNHSNWRYPQGDWKGYKTRNNLMAQLSEDDGKSWFGGLLLDVRNDVSYPDGCQEENGQIHIIYDYDRHGAREILTASFTEHDILEGRFDSPNSYYRRLVSKATGPKTDSVKG